MYTILCYTGHYHADNISMLFYAVSRRQGSRGMPGGDSHQRYFKYMWPITEQTWPRIVCKTRRATLSRGRSWAWDPDSLKLEALTEQSCRQFDNHLFWLDTMETVAESAFFLYKANFFFFSLILTEAWEHLFVQLDKFDFFFFFLSKIFFCGKESRHHQEETLGSRWSVCLRYFGVPQETLHPLCIFIRICSFKVIADDEVQLQPRLTSIPKLKAY